MKSNTKTLGTRLKQYEADYETCIDSEKYLVVRIDGHKFSKFTKGFKKPFDNILSNTMVQTTDALVKEFGAVTGYTQSDEISLIFRPTFKEKLRDISLQDFLCLLREDSDNDTENCDRLLKITHKETGVEYIAVYEKMDKSIKFLSQSRDGVLFLKEIENIDKIPETFDIKYREITNQQIFGGRVQKLTSLIAGFTTMKFNNIIRDIFKESISSEKESLCNSFHQSYEEDEVNDYYSLIDNKIGKAWFDARVYGVDSKEEVYNSIMWRVRDAEKNSRSVFAQTYCSHKSLLNKDGKEQIEYCLKETGQDWNKIQDGYKYGFLIKRKKYLKPIIFSESDGVMVHSTNEFIERTKIFNYPAIGFSTFSEENVNKIISKYV